MNPFEHPAAPVGGARLLEVRRIWSAGRHNAFTDLLRHRGYWWCVFREAARHVSPDGRLRLIASGDGAEWDSAALLEMPGKDLRDGKLNALPDGRLMLLAAGVSRVDGASRRQSYVWFSRDGRQWTPPRPVGAPDDWLWRASWHGDRCLSIAYRGERRFTTRLYLGNPAGEFSPWVDALCEEGNPNESALVFRTDGEAVALLRRDPGHALLGRSQLPYRDWAWRECNVRIGGPQMVVLPDGRLVAGVRLYRGHIRTALCLVDLERSRLDECLTLPSGGDNSYPGLVWHENRLWVSYYASHEGRTAIYLAQAAFD